MTPHLTPLAALSPLEHLSRNFGQVIQLFWPVAVVALVASLALTPLCRKVALHFRVVDRPDDFLKPHGQPIPYLGGIAIFAGWLAGILVAQFAPAIHVRTGMMWGFAAAGLAITAIGLFDDMRAMSSRTKLAANVAVALFLLGLGLGDQVIRVITDVMKVDFEPGQRWLELAYSVPIMLLIIVGSCNATNLIDGLDGQCAGVLGIISVGFLILAAHLYHPDQPIAQERVVLALAMLGGALGFLPFNVNPAKIFMGDAGSMLLGLNAAVIMLLFAERQPIRWMLGVVMVFGLPLGDMILTLARRWRNGRRLMEGDRSHFYDQLRDRGLTVKQVVWISYLLTTAFTLAGTMTVVFLRVRYAVMVLFLFVVGVIALVWKFDMAGIERRGTPPVQAPKPSNSSSVVSNP